jgi:hypothetical protein
VQQGPAGSSILTVTVLPPSPTPTDEMAATSLLPTTISTSGVSEVFMLTTVSPAAGTTSALSALAVSCSVFYMVAQNDSCYAIWTGFDISQDQFASWNPSPMFPQCLIFPGDLVCVQLVLGTLTTMKTLPATSMPTSSSIISSTITMTATIISTVMVSTLMPSTVSNSSSLTVSPFTFNTASNSAVTPPSSISGY